MTIHCSSNLIKIIIFNTFSIKIFSLSLSLSLSLSHTHTLFFLFLLSLDSLFSLLSHFLLSFTGFCLLYLFSFFLTGSTSLYFFLSPTLSPLPSLARPSLSHRFPMGACHSALAVTVGHLVMLGLGHGSRVTVWRWIGFGGG